MRTGVKEEDDDNNNNRNQEVLAVKGKNYRKSCDLSGPPNLPRVPLRITQQHPARPRPTG